MHIPSSATIILLFAGLRFVFMFDVPFTPCRNIGKAHYVFRPERPNPVDREKRLPRLTRLLALAVKCEGLAQLGHPGLCRVGAQRLGDTRTHHPDHESAAPGLPHPGGDLAPARRNLPTGAG